MIKFYFFPVFFYGIFLLLSFIGWGSLLKNTFFPHQKTDWGQKAAWGVSLTILVGGLLNLYSLVSNQIVALYVMLGVVNFIVFNLSSIKNYRLPSLSRWWQEDKIGLLLAVVFLLFVLVYYFLAISLRLLTMDDLEAYFAFPFKMLEQGCLGEDPFSERRMSALGGQSFLHTLVLCLIKGANVHVIDPGVASFIVLGLLWAVGKQLQISYKLTLLVGMIFLFIPWPRYTNTTSLIMGLALFLALFQKEVIEDDISVKRSIANSLVTALLLSALFASKTNFIAPGVIYFLVLYFLKFLFQRQKKIILLEFFFSICLTSLFLWPWMMASLKSSGTLLYPLFGRGYHRSAYGFNEYSVFTIDSMIKAIYKTLCGPKALFLMLFTVISLANTSLKNSLKSIVIGISACLGLIVINILTRNAFKYSFSFFYAALLMLMLFALRSSKERPLLRMAWVGGVFLLIGHLLMLYFHDGMDHKYAAAFRDKWWKNKGKSPHALHAKDYLKIQAVIPPQETILARVKDPFLLNFKRNNIFIVDFLIPGPKPGMPIFAGSEAISQYLCSQGVKYVMFSYNLDHEDLKKLLTSKDMWVRQQGLFTLKFQNEIEELGRTRRKIYDDGQTFVIDLSILNPM
jgi:hypothetical protein